MQTITTSQAFPCNLEKAPPMGKSELCRSPRASLAWAVFCDVAWIQNTVRGWEMMAQPPTQGTRTVELGQFPLKEVTLSQEPFFFHVTNAINMLTCYRATVMWTLCPEFSRKNKSPYGLHPTQKQMDHVSKGNLTVKESPGPSAPQLYLQN